MDNLVSKVNSAMSGVVMLPDSLHNINYTMSLCKNEIDSSFTLIITSTRILSDLFHARLFPELDSTSILISVNNLDSRIIQQLDSCFRPNPFRLMRRIIITPFLFLPTVKSLLNQYNIKIDLLVVDECLSNNYSIITSIPRNKHIFLNASSNIILREPLLVQSFTPSVDYRIVCLSDERGMLSSVINFQTQYNINRMMLLFASISEAKNSIQLLRQITSIPVVDFDDPEDYIARISLYNSTQISKVIVCSISSRSIGLDFGIPYDAVAIMYKSPGVEKDIFHGLRCISRDGTRYVIVSESNQQLVTESISRVSSITKSINLPIQYFPPVTNDNQTNLIVIEDDKENFSDQARLATTLSGTPTWLEKYNCLKQFLDKYVRYPNTTSSNEEEAELALWVKRCRRAEKSLTRKELEMLRDLPEWNRMYKDEVWEDMYNQVLEFAKDNQRLPDNTRSALYYWISHQRKRVLCTPKEILPSHILDQVEKRINEDGKPNIFPLSQEQVEKLRQIPCWMWFSRRQPWNVRLSCFLRDVKNNRVSTSRSITWISSQRYLCKKNKLSKERINILNELVPNWQTLRFSEESSRKRSRRRSKGNSSELSDTDEDSG